MERKFLPSSHPLRSAVLRTLSFFDLLGSALTRDELEFFLWRDSKDSSSLDEFLAQVLWREERTLLHSDGVFSLRDEKNFLERARTKRHRQLEWLKIAASWRFIFQICPFVEFVGLCNSVALGDVDEDSDLDVFVVAKPGRLFLARAWLTLLTQCFGVRRHSGRVKQRFCLSFYATSEALNFHALLLDPSHPERDPYLAFWLRSLLPFAGELTAYQKLIHANQTWLKHFFVPQMASRRWFRERTSLHRATRWMLEALSDMDWLENVLSQFQIRRAERKRAQLSDPSGTVISPTMLKFHDQDARLTYARRVELRLRDLQ